MAAFSNSLCLVTLCSILHVCCDDFFSLFTGGTIWLHVRPFSWPCSLPHISTLPFTFRHLLLPHLEPALCAQGISRAATEQSPSSCAGDGAGYGKLHEQGQCQGGAGSRLQSGLPSTGQQHLAKKANQRESLIPND